MKSYSKEAYEPCIIEILELSAADVITTSPLIDDDKDQGEWI